MLYKVENKEDFKTKNLTNWYKNSDFWLRGKMRHLNDVYSFTGNVIFEKISELKLSRKINLIDLGCGEGWILRLMKEKNININYIGVDFNQMFIEANQIRYKEYDAKFLLHDLEKEPPKELIGFADVAVNFFNFFEIPDISNAFKNVSKMLSTGGILIIVNIDPIMQILSVSESFEDFKNSLKLYEKFQTNLGYDKDIDIGDQRSGRIYKSLLYSTATYVELGKQNGLFLNDYKEVIKTSNYVPQIYQYIFLKK